MPNLFYRWQPEVFESCHAAFERDRKSRAVEDAAYRRIRFLKGKLLKKNVVLSELMEKHVQLKKNLGHPEGTLGSPRNSRRSRRLRPPLVRQDRVAAESRGRLGRHRHQRVVSRNAGKGPA